MHQKRLFTLLSLLVLLTLLAACGGGDEVEDVSAVEEAAPVVEEAAPTAEEAAPAADTEEATEAETVVEVQEPMASRLDTVLSRGKLICGGNAGLPAFGFLDSDGAFNGYDIDYCKVLAVALFGVADDSTLEIRPLTAAERPIVLQTNEVDVIIRNTTWTLSRDTEWAADFGPTTFYDGQGMMVRADSGITTLAELQGGSVCVQAGTTTELNLADIMAAEGIDYEPKVFPDAPSTLAPYNEGTCDGITADKSGLISQKQELDNPEDHVILEVTMSKEPLGPAYPHGDNQWGDVVDWSVNCTIAAEELGIDSSNVDDMLGSDDPNIKRILGVEGALGEGLGLSNDFCATIITEMGNYGEIYNRHLGPDTPYNVPRGLNNQWNNGGILYAPPFR